MRHAFGDELMGKRYGNAKLLGNFPKFGPTKPMHLHRNPHPLRKLRQGCRQTIDLGSGKSGLFG